MELELVLTELQPLELSHFRHFCIVGYRVCVMNSSYSFQWIILKSCIHIVDILKMCMWVFGGARVNFDRIIAFRP